MKVTYIPSLDGLRAISFLLVFAAHAGLEQRVPGGFGVTVFFFLSGFLITTLMRAEYEHRGAVNLKHFWLRRILRIWPPFYLVLFGAIILTFAEGEGSTLSVPAVASQVFNVSNYWIIFRGFGHQPDGTGVVWSLAVEEHFYLVFPLLFVSMQRLKITPRRQALLLWGLCAAVLAWRLVLVFVYHAPLNRTYMATDTRIDSILFGCALAIWHNPAVDEPLLPDSWIKALILPLALAILLASFLIRTDSFRETLRYSMQGIALNGVFVAAIRLHAWGPFRLLNSRLLVFLGTLSYSLYLVHHVVLQAMHRWIVNQLVQAVLGLAVAVAISWAIYRLVEKPCARLRRRLEDTHAQVISA